MSEDAQTVRSSDPAAVGGGSETFRRSLRLRDLILFGIVCVQPVGPVPVFGILGELSHGQAATAIALAMLAMLPTAYSYGWMAARFPFAGSAYTYVSRGVHPALGFLAGWAMVLDYLLIPIFNVIYCAATMHRIAPGVSYFAWAALFVGAITSLNLRGIRASMRANQILVVVMTLVIVAAIGLSIDYLARIHGLDGLFSIAPFYQHDAFDLHTMATATAFAAIAYIGFDAVTTLAEEVANPRRTVAVATTLVCLITGLGSVLIVYLAQLVWPAYQSFTDLDTAYLDVSQRVGGTWLFGGMAATLVVAAFGAGLTGQAGAARLCFGMGRSGVLPRRFFAYVDQKTLQPSRNVWLIAAVAFGGSVFLDLERATELLNFGAFLAFMGVNLAAFRSLVTERKQQPGASRLKLIVPVVGFGSCLAIWLNLPVSARRLGFAWLAIGVLIQAIRTRGFRSSAPGLLQSEI
jgi:putrescine importer